MPNVKKFLHLDADGQLREQTGSDTIQVANGVNALDAVNKGQLDGVLADMTDLINAEAARATQAEAALGDSITAEAAARVAGDAALSASLTSETNARTAADTALGGRIDTEIADRQAAITSEQTARTAADAALRTDLDAEIARATAAEATEATARTNADAALQAAIDALSASSNTALSNAIASLSADLDAEEAARIAADAALQTELDAEEARAAAAEAAEEAARIAADNALQGEIDAEETRAAAAEAAIAADLDAEEARALAAEQDLADDIASEQSRAQAAESFTLPADAVAFTAAEGLIAGNRVLVYGAAHADCGIYVVQTGGAFARAPDMAAGSDAAGAYVYVEAASDAGAAPGTAFVCAHQGTAAVGSAALEFVIFSRMENLSFSAGVQKIGTAVSLKMEAGKPVYVNGSNELTFRITGPDLSIDGSGNLKVDGDLVGGQFVAADGKHSHEAIAKTMTSASTVGVFVDGAGAAATYEAAAAFGCVDAKSGSDARVVMAGLSAVAAGALSSFSEDERVFLGSAAGVFAKYADIPSGKWAVPVGFKRGAKLQVHLMPAALKA